MRGRLTIWRYFGYNDTVDIHSFGGDIGLHSCQFRFLPAQALIYVSIYFSECEWDTVHIVHILYKPFARRQIHIHELILEKKKITGWAFTGWGTMSEYGYMRNTHCACNHAFGYWWDGCVCVIMAYSATESARARVQDGRLAVWP